MRRSPTLSRLAACLAAGLLAGCAGYQLGGGPAGGPPPALRLEPVVNRAFLPGAAQAVAEAVSEALLSAGTALDDGAPASLALTVVEFRRETATLDANDSGRASGVRVFLAVEATYRDGATTRFANRRFVRSELALTADLHRAEAQTLPILARRLAQDVRDACLAAF